MGQYTRGDPKGRAVKVFHESVAPGELYSSSIQIRVLSRITSIMVFPTAVYPETTEVRGRIAFVRATVQKEVV